MTMTVTRPTIAVDAAIYKGSPTISSINYIVRTTTEIIDPIQNKLIV